MLHVTTFHDPLHEMDRLVSLYESLVEARRDITLVELRAALAERGIGVAVSTLWRFFDRHFVSAGTHSTRGGPVELFATRH